ncbi:LysE/ArgO family amino acid transporter [Aliagarivorans taiwanensis]|uniref:LysE/ArgO family amino acid transporter n=1 Tax=Aliagarivorans taiwanensis TaxID=561966 RepID=UPI00041174C9|nr:LysE/ArgO family amino acid transporter [Aliagarivorans taiwanensis]
MILSSYLSGLGLMAGMIMPIGMQNAFVLNQGIRRQHHLFVASFCSFADVIFMSIGVWGGARLFASQPWLLYTMTICGSLFMLYYGWQCAQRAWRGQSQVASARTQGQFKAVLLACMAFTLLNPHVYIDTILVLGSFAANLTPEARPAFVMGGITASFAWFFSLSLLGSKLAPVLSRPTAQRIIDGVIAVMMLGLVVFLLKTVFA